MSIRTDSEQDKITFLTYFYLLNRLTEQSDDKGFVFKEISEMKWGSTIRGTAPKGMSISKKIKRYERGGTTTTRMGMKELRKPKIYLRTGGRTRHGLNCVPEFLVFASKSRSNCQIQILLRDTVCHVADSKHNLRTKCRACLVRRAGPGPPWD